MLATGLEGSDLVVGLDGAQRAALNALVVPREVAAGEVVFRLGEEASDVFVVLEGTVELTFPLHLLGESRDVCFHTLRAGRTLAWSALVPPHRLTMGARTTAPVRLAALPRAALLELVQQQPALGARLVTNLLHVVATRLTEAQALWVREVQRNVAQIYR